MSMNYWSKEEDDILLKYYPLGGSELVINELKRQLNSNRDKISVYNRSRKLCAISKNDHWSKKEDNILIEYYPEYGPKKVSEIINNTLKTNRTEYATKTRARRLNITMVMYHDDWIYKNYKKYKTRSELWNAYKNTFGSTMTLGSFNKHMGCLGLKSEREDRIDKLNEIFDELSAIYTYEGIKKAQEIILNKTGIHMTCGSISNYMNRRGVYVLDSTISRIRSKYRSIPIGTISFHKCSDRKNNIIAMVKTDTGWKSYGQYICGTKEGYLAIPLDNDQKNLNPENWMLIPKKDAAKMIVYGFRSDNPEITKTGVLWCKLVESLESQGINATEIVNNIEDGLLNISF